MDKAIVISGEENVRAVRTITRLHFWRITAQLVPAGFKPRKGHTVRAFNAEYGQSARTWAQVANLADGMIKASRGMS